MFQHFWKTFKFFCTSNTVSVNTDLPIFQLRWLLSWFAKYLPKLFKSSIFCKSHQFQSFPHFATSDDFYLTTLVLKIYPKSLNFLHKVKIPSDSFYALNFLLSRYINSYNRLIIDSLTNCYFRGLVLTVEHNVQQSTQIEDILEYLHRWICC